MAAINRQWILSRRPQGLLNRDDLSYREAIMDDSPLAQGQIRVRNLAFLCAPTMRNWMEDKGNSLYPSMPLGAPVMAPAGAVVVASADPLYPAGARISMLGSWQDYETFDTDSRTVQRLPDGLSIVESLGKFGLNSATAYFGLLRVGKPVAGETVLVSGAAGSTGSVVAQIAKLKGCRVIGIAGGPEKCRLLVDELGLDDAIDYRGADLVSAVRATAPGGVDIFFDNVGGEVLQAAIENMARLGRIVLCGQISGYNDGRPVDGPTNMMRLIYGSIRMQGFLMGDYRAELPNAVQDLVAWERDGLLRFRVDARGGFDQLPETFNALFTGDNQGTLLGVISSDASN